MEEGAARDPKRPDSRDLPTAWLAATGVYAAAGAVLAAIAWGRAQYPLLAPIEVVALAASAGAILALLLALRGADPAGDRAIAPPPEAPLAHGVAALRFMGRVAFDREHRPKVGYWPIADEPRTPRVTARAHPGARALHAALTALGSEAPPRAVAEDDPVATDAAVVEQLRALGYAQ